MEWLPNCWLWRERGRYITCTWSVYVSVLQLRRPPNEACTERKSHKVRNEKNLKTKLITIRKQFLLSDPKSPHGNNHSVKGYDTTCLFTHPPSRSPPSTETVHELQLMTLHFDRMWRKTFHSKPDVLLFSPTLFGGGGERSIGFETGFPDRLCWGTMMGGALD